MYDIITFGSATKDIFVRPKKISLLQYDKSASRGGFCFLPGSKVDVDEMRFTSGGGGTNVAATFAGQGFSTAFVGVVGPDVSGQEIIRELAGLGVETKHIQTTREKPTNHSVIILNDAMDRTVLAYRGASELLTKEAIPWQELKAAWFYLAPLTGLLCAPAGDPATTPFEELILFAKAQGIKVAVNPSMAQLSLPHFAKLAGQIDVLLLNQEEASFLTKIPRDEEGKIFAKIDELCRGIVVMTRGGEGVVASDGKHIYRAKPHEERKVVDTLGAGDAFASGFVSEIMRSRDIEKAIQVGMANAEGCLTEIGAKRGLLKKGQSFIHVPVQKEACDNKICLVR